MCCYRAIALLVSLAASDGFLKVAGIQDLHVHLSCHFKEKKRKEETKKAEFLTLEQSLKCSLPAL